MNWLWIVLAVGIVGFIIAKISGSDNEDAAATGLGAAFGCGSVIFQIFLTVVSLALIISLFSWLFGGCS